MSLEIWYIILNKLNFCERQKARLVCKSFNNICKLPDECYKITNAYNKEISKKINTYIKNTKYNLYNDCKLDILQILIKINLYHINRCNNEIIFELLDNIPISYSYKTSKLLQLIIKNNRIDLFIKLINGLRNSSYYVNESIRLSLKHDSKKIFNYIINNEDLKNEINNNYLLDMINHYNKNVLFYSV